MKGNSRARIIFDKPGVIFDAGHVIYTSGLHGKMYVNKELIWPYIDDVKFLGSIIAEKTEQLNPDVVLVPKGGIYAVAHWTADYLYHVIGHKVMALYVGKDKETGEFSLSREYAKLIENRRVLVVDDVLNTNGTINSLINVARLAGGKIIGAAVLINRSGEYALTHVNAPETFCLVDKFLPSWDADQCPLCEAGVPLSSEVGQTKKTA